MGAITTRDFLGGLALGRELRFEAPGLPRMSVIDRYLATRFLVAYVVFASSAAFLFLIIDLFSNMDSLLKHGLVKGAIERYGTMFPELFFTLSPHLVLLAGLWTVVSLIRSNELVPLYASGYSPRRIAAPMLIVATLLGGLAWADRELLLPQLGDLRRERRLLRQPRETLRPVSDGRGGVLSAQHYMPHVGELYLPRFVVLDEGGGEALSVLGRRAVYEGEADGSGGGWRFFEGIRIANVGTETRVSPVPPEGTLIETAIRRSDVEAAIDSPSFMSAAQLREQIERSPVFAPLEVQLYERFTQPLAGVALLLLALPVILGAATGGNLYLRGLACLGMGVGYFFLGAITFELGKHGVLPAWLAASFPVLLAGGAGALALWWA